MRFQLPGMLPRKDRVWRRLRAREAIYLEECFSAPAPLSIGYDFTL